MQLPGANTLCISTYRGNAAELKKNSSPARILNRDAGIQNNLRVIGYHQAMPIYEFACPQCRRIFNFLSKRLNPDRLPVCPKCGNTKMEKQMSRFAMSRGLKEQAAGGANDGGDNLPDMDDPRIMRAMSELERDMEHLDENNPRHLAHMMKKMKDAMPPGTMPKEIDVAIKRLEAGEAPEKIEEDMGDVFGEMMGESGGADGGGYTRDTGLYDY
jgi:putative FmdB family regulatory protein